MAVSKRIDLFIRPNSQVTEEQAWDYAYVRANTRDNSPENIEGGQKIFAHYYDITDARTSKKWMVFGDDAQELLQLDKHLVILDTTELNFGEVDLTPQFDVVNQKIDELDFRVENYNDFTSNDLVQVINNRAQETQAYFREINDIVGSDVRTVFEYGYYPQNFFGSAELVSLMPDPHVTLAKNVSESILADLTIDASTKLIDCKNYSIKQIYHALHLYQVNNEIADVIIRGVDYKTYGLENGWDLFNYQDSTTILDYKYVNGERVDLERQVAVKVNIPYSLVGAIAHYTVYDANNVQLYVSGGVLSEPSNITMLTTDGSYYIGVEIRKDGNLVFSDYAPFTKDGYDIKTNVQLLNADDLETVVYLNSPTPTQNKIALDDIKAALPEHLKDTAKVYADVTDDPYDSRVSYDRLMIKCASQEISRIYVYEKEVFGVTRWQFTVDLLESIGVDLVETKYI